MPRKSRSSNYRRSKKQSYKKRSQNRKRQQGGKAVMPMKYFNSNHNSYYAQNQNAYPGAVSYGVPHQQVLATGPDLNPGYANQQGGGVMPAEFYGNNSGRYFEAGAPELATCTSAYGVIHPTSHGVVLSGENAGFMGPNLAPFPNFQDMTGGSRKRRTGRKTKKAKKVRKLKKNKKSKNSKKSKKSRKSRK